MGQVVIYLFHLWFCQVPLCHVNGWWGEYCSYVNALVGNTNWVLLEEALVELGEIPKWNGSQYWVILEQI